jgi:hypothetical protein
MEPDAKTSLIWTYPENEIWLHVAVIAPHLAQNSSNSVDPRRFSAQTWRSRRCIWQARWRIRDFAGWLSDIAGAARTIGPSRFSHQGGADEIFSPVMAGRSGDDHTSSVGGCRARWRSARRSSRT